MSDDARMHVGARRRDGKYPVQFVFPLSGRRLNKVMTKEQIDEDIIKSRRSGSGYVVIGYTPPPKTARELEAEIAEELGEELP